MTIDPRAGTGRGPVPVRTVLAALAVALLTTMMTGTAAAAAVRADGGSTAAGTALDLVLDSSGSMAEPAAGGSTKIVAARAALTQVVAGLPADARVGMRVFGATVGSGPSACTDSQSVAPVAVLDKAKLTSAIAAYRPLGETPIGYALQQAVRDLPTEGKRSIVLVSDGESNCAPDPCVVAQQLSGSGIDLQINVVGLKLSGKARTQMQCIARAGHGTYYDASNARSIVSSITSVSLRASRPSSISGTPVQGTTSAPGAPTISAGQYTDRIGGDQDQRFYVLPKSPGSTLHVSVVGRPNVPLDAQAYDGLSLRLRTGDGAECGDDRDQVWSTVDVISATVRQKSPQASPACDAAPSLVLSVTRGSETSPGLAPKTGDSPIELLVVDESPVANFDVLEPRVEDSRQVRVAAPEASPDGAPTAGGASFTNAAPLEPGHSYSDTIRGGEALFYRVRVAEGQAAAFTATIAPSTGGTYTTVGLDAFAPDRARIRVPEDTSTAIGKSPSYTFATADVLRTALPPVRYRNRESSSKDVTGVSLAGWYYFEIVAKKSGSEWQAPLRLSVSVSGEGQTAPAYATAVVTDPLAAGVTEPSAAPTSSPDPSVAGVAPDAAAASSLPNSAASAAATELTVSTAADESTSGGSGPSLLVVLCGGLLVFLAGGGAAWLLRRRTAV